MKKKLIFYSVVGIVFIGILAWIFFPSGDAGVANKRSGLNMQLPGANVKGDTAKDKLSFYSAALEDSMKRVEQIRMDPNRRDTVTKVVVDKPVPVYSKAVHADEEPIEAKIKSIQRQLYSSNHEEYRAEEIKPVATQRKVAVTTDPEIEAINSTLDKIMAIQNPKTEPAAISLVDRAGYAVSAGEENEATYFGKKRPEKSQQAFLDDGARSKQSANALTAIFSNQQEVMSGMTVKMELGSAISVNGIRVPAGTAIYGIAAVQGERCLIHIPSIQYQHNLLPVSLNVYDMDGLEGIYIPGSIMRDVAKQSADDAIQSTGVAGFGLSLKTQVAAAGIGAAKNLLSKKVRQVRITVTGGYKVLLRDHK